MATGHYDETVDGYEWLWRDAEGCLAAARAADFATAVEDAVAHLLDAGLHAEDCDQDEMACLERDARLAVEAARAKRSAVR